MQFYGSTLCVCVCVCLCYILELYLWSSSTYIFGNGYVGRALYKEAYSVCAERAWSKRGPVGLGGFN